MKIVAVDVWTVIVPTIEGRVHSPEIVPETGWDRVPKHLIRLRTDCELVGIGETGRGEQIQQRPPRCSHGPGADWLRPVRRGDEL